MTRKRPRIGLALGGGAARGWAHIGVIRALERAGYAPEIVVGTSIGAVVGGCYAAGKLDELEAFARSLTKSRVLWLMDFHIGSGLISGDRLKRLLRARPRRHAHRGPADPLRRRRHRASLRP